MRHAFIFLALGMAGCSNMTATHCGDPQPPYLFHEDLRATFTHTVELLEDVPALGLEAGMSTAPTSIYWAQDENFLLALGVDGEAQGRRAMFRVVKWTAIDRTDGSPSWGPEAEQNAFLVDWSRELMTVSVQELGLEDLESVTWFAAAEDPETYGGSRPLQRDPETDVLTMIEIPNAYFARTDEGFEVRVRHRFERAER